ncbi:hypothetical protein [Methylobacterium oryzihabitans]|uniref:hypothetical protein n=1 Tax=Methylobacterium oryzihabitans TaxID=2499852 RepID=UPI001651BD14|nr:hypothetical protein [Methylobacterium oryzihabitans]
MAAPIGRPRVRDKRRPGREASRATSTAWNPTRGVAAETLCNQKGSVLAFPETRAAARAAAGRMVAGRTLLPADAEEMSAAAAARLVR